MKEHVQEFGVRKYTGNDFIELQSEPLLAIQTLLAEYPPCIIQGCELSEGAENTYDISAGMLSLRGLDAEQNPCTKIVPFAGISGSILPAYFTIAHETQTRVYGNGQSKPIAHAYKAELSTLHPTEGVEFLEITSSGAPRLTDVLGITQKLAQEGGQAKDVLVNFATATTRVLPASGSKLGILMGNVSKWFTDLKALAFKDRIAKTDLDEALATELNNKVDKVTGKGLSTNDYTTIEKNKLEKIAAGAGVNVQADWAESDTADDRYIKNKPTTLPANGGTADAVRTVNGNEVKLGSEFNSDYYLHINYSGAKKNIPGYVFCNGFGTTTSNLAAKTFISDAAQGTPPLSVLSNTLVPKLNAELLDGQHADDFYNKIALYKGDDYPIDPNEVEAALALCLGENCPTTDIIYYVHTYFHSSTKSSRAQLAIAYYGDSQMYIRNKYDQRPWGPWERLAKASEIPTSLPANGGNADMLDNKHASEFATNNHTHAGTYQPVGNYAASTHNHAGTYEPVFPKNTAFNKNFETSAVSILNHIGTSKAKVGTSTNVARADHVHGMPDIASESSFGFMSSGDKTKMNSLFKIICAGQVDGNGQKGDNPIGGFYSSRISEGRYKITTSSPWGVMIFVTGSGGYPAATYGRIDTAFYVITTNGTELQVMDAPFSFIVVQF